MDTRVDILPYVTQPTVWQCMPIGYSYFTNLLDIRRTNYQTHQSGILWNYEVSVSCCATAEPNELILHR